MYRKEAESAKKNQEIARLKKEWLFPVAWGKKETGVGWAFGSRQVNFIRDKDNEDATDINE